MNKSPETKRLKQKLFTRSKFLLPFIAILFGSSLLIICEYPAKGSVSGVGIYYEGGLKDNLPPATIITLPGKMIAIISLSGTGICGEDDFRW
jgi:hypothetical protein